MSLKRQILDKVRAEYPDWFLGARVERFANDLGFSASNGARRARELAREGLFERKIERGLVYYRFLPQEPPTPQKVEDEMQQHLELAVG